MATSHAVSIGTTATDVTTAVISGSAPNEMLIFNNGAATVFIGGSDVTTSNGVPVAPGASLALGVNVEVYGIVASGTVEVRVLEGA